MKAIVWLAAALAAMTLSHTATAGEKTYL